MGLDMYLQAELYCSEYSKSDAYPIVRACASRVGLPEQPLSENFGWASLTVPVGYWRKANQVHAWFVANVQDGRDECQTSNVSREQLVELRAVCSELLRSRDERQVAKLLPPQEGFFFGGYKVDEYYWQEVEHTVEVIDRALALGEEIDFYYRASW